jgi:hypothetical protein
LVVSFKDLDALAGGSGVEITSVSQRHSGMKGMSSSIAGEPADWATPLSMIRLTRRGRAGICGAAVASIFTHGTVRPEYVVEPRVIMIGFSSQFSEFGPYADINTLSRV